LKLIKVFYDISKLSAQIIKLHTVNGTAYLKQISISTFYLCSVAVTIF